MINAILTTIILARLLAEEAGALLMGAPGCHALGHPSNSRRARVSCAWTTARWAARNRLWSAAWKGEAAICP